MGLVFSEVGVIVLSLQPAPTLQAPASVTEWEGFAQYISCNSDETDAAFNNSARDPTCMAGDPRAVWGW